MIRLTRSHLQPIGIDVGQDAIRMLQIEVTGESLAVVAACQMPFADEARRQPELRMPLAVEMVRQMLRQAPFAGRKAVAALPREIVHIKNFRLPLMPAAELEAAVSFEARNLFSFDIDEAQVRFLPAGEVRQGNDVLQEVIVLAARNEDIGLFVEQVHRCGLVLESLDVEPCALFRSVERFIRRREDEQEVHVLVDLGYGGSQVVIGKGREISFIKSIEIGCRQFHEAISSKLGISLEEASGLRRRLIEPQEPGETGEKRDPVRQAVFDATRSIMEQLGKEISLCLRYQSVTFRGHRPTRLRLLGPEAADAQLQTLLQSIVTIPVEPGRPLFSVDSSRMKSTDRRGTLSEWALPLGLALRQTTGRFGARDGKPRDPWHGRKAGPVDPKHVAAGAEIPAPRAQEVAHA